MKFKTLAVLLVVALASCTGPAADKVKITNTADTESLPVHLTGKTEHRITEYRLVTGKCMGEGSIQLALNQVQDQMKDAMGLGWQPQGGISVSVDKDYRYTCTQAIVMIK